MFVIFINTLESVYQKRFFYIFKIKPLVTGIRNLKKMNENIYLVINNGDFDMASGKDNAGNLDALLFEMTGTMLRYKKQMLERVKEPLSTLEESRKGHTAVPSSTSHPFFFNDQGKA